MPLPPEFRSEVWAGRWRQACLRPYSLDLRERAVQRSEVGETISEIAKVLRIGAPYPAKDRSGRLGMVEEPHLGRLMDKIRSPQATPPTERLQFIAPPTGPAPPAPIPATTPTTTEG